jgi:hypothetical protein
MLHRSTHAPSRPACAARCGWLVGLLLVVPGSLAADALIGEWAIDADWCAESRFTFTADGRHEALVNDDGWQVLASGRYTRAGDRITVVTHTGDDHLQVLAVDERRLVLRNESAALREAIGTDTLELVRCPAR